MISRYFFWLLVLFSFSCSSPPSTIGQSSPPAEMQSIQASSITLFIPTMPSSSTPSPEHTTISTPRPSLTATSQLLTTITHSPLVVDPCLPENSSSERGTVTQIIDGDTIYVRLQDGVEYSLRYIGIDAPERGHLFFEESYQANADLVLNKEVTLIKDVSEVDRYERLLRYVVVGDIFVNQQLVQGGFATAARYPPDVACAETFEQMEAEARIAQVGMWIPQPTAQASDAQLIIVEVNKVAEWVDIQNQSSEDVDLQGWKLVSERGSQECYLQGIIKAGEILRIWSMAAQGEGYSCGFASSIWNNSQPDPAVLYNPQGREVSRK